MGLFLWLCFGFCLVVSLFFVGCLVVGFLVCFHFYVVCLGCGCGCLLFVVCFIVGRYSYRGLII